ncbi:MAG: hypothetical protein WCG85_06775 [Polyangia bacterium]
MPARGAIVIVIVGALAAAGCGSKLDPVPVVEGCSNTGTVTYDLQMKDFFVRNCLTCHSTTSENRNGAPATVNFDSYAAALPYATLANNLVQAGAMPPLRSGLSVSKADHCLMDVWVQQGAPEK